MVKVKGHIRKIGTANTRGRFRTFLQKSEEEFNKFKSTKQEIYLAQAGEKLWNAYNIMLELLVKQRVPNWKIARKFSGELAIALHNKDFIDMFTYSIELHHYFYRGHGETDYEIENYVIAHKMIAEAGKKYL